MNNHYPVVVEVESPLLFERVQLALRAILLLLASAVLGGFGFLGLIYLALPAVAAVLVSHKGGDRYLEEDGPALTRALGVVVGILGYMLIVDERLPVIGGEGNVRLRIERSGSPTTRSALLRILTAIPSAAVLALLGFVSALVWLVAAVMVIVEETYASRLYDFQCGVLRWQARLLAYLASLVDEYPPFRLETGPKAR
jgi:hypothetical protein